jgi:hypothetical protein
MKDPRPLTSVFNSGIRSNEPFTCHFESYVFIWRLTSTVVVLLASIQGRMIKYETNGRYSGFNCWVLCGQLRQQYILRYRGFQPVHAYKLSFLAATKFRLGLR